jgi:hypothetical protein
VNRSPALLLAACAFLLTGCAAVKHANIPYDNAKPAGWADCRGATPAKGDACLALVRANQWYSDSHLRVAAGDSYCVTVPPGQKWFDLQRVNHAPDGEPGSGMMNIYASRKRFRDTSALKPGESRSDRARTDGWFALIAAVVLPGAANPDDREEVQQSSMGGPGNCAKSTGKLLNVEKPGELVFYPNDATLPDDKKYFYNNNSGQVWVVITKVE